MSTTPPESPLVEPEGVNAGSAAAERDRRPSGDVEVAPADPIPPSHGTDGEMIGAPGQRDGVPGQQYEVGEG